MTIEPSRQRAQPTLGPLPTAEQTARRTARKRFNGLFVYLPLGIVTFLWILLIVGLIWLTVAGRWFHVDTNREYYRALISGVADAFIVLMMLPLLLVCALPPIGAVGFIAWRRGRKEPQRSDGGKLPLFWRIDNLVTRLQSATAAFTPKLARPVIMVYGAVSFLRKLLQEIRKFIARELNRYVD